MVLKFEAVREVELSIEVRVEQIWVTVTRHDVPPALSRAAEISSVGRALAPARTLRCRWEPPSSRRSLCKTFLPVRAKSRSRETAPAIVRECREAGGSLLLIVAQHLGTAGRLRGLYF